MEKSIYYYRTFKGSTLVRILKLFFNTIVLMSIGSGLGYFIDLQFNSELAGFTTVLVPMFAMAWFHIYRPSSVASFFEINSDVFICHSTFPKGAGFSFKRGVHSSSVDNKDIQLIKTKKELLVIKNHQFHSLVLPRFYHSDLGSFELKVDPVSKKLLMIKT